MTQSRWIFHLLSLNKKILKFPAAKSKKKQTSKSPHKLVIKKVGNL